MRVVSCALAIACVVTFSAPGLSAATDASPAARTVAIQAVVDDMRQRLSLSDAVTVLLVEKDERLASVERQRDPATGFKISFEAAFLDRLTQDEIDAVIAHELGHVWIFTHHPYLQTEELANDIAMRVVPRESLEQVYKKVWQQAGPAGDLIYLAAKH